MIRRLLWLALALLAWWAIRRVLGARTARRPAVTGAAGPRASPGRRPPRVVEAMVRDRICNTFLPRSSAIVLREGGEEHYFCSEACRSAYLARQASPVSS